MRTDHQHPSRRTILGAIGAVGTIAGVPIAAVARIEERSANRRPWDLLVAELERARAEYAAADAAFDRADAASDIGRPSMDMIHWREFTMRDRNNVARVMDLDKAERDFLDGEGTLWWAADREAAIGRHRAALDSVREFRRLEAEHDALHGYTAASDALDRATQWVADAEQALIDMPAPDAEAQLWKLEHLFHEDRRDSFPARWDDDTPNPVLADARRLLSSGRA